MVMLAVLLASAALRWPLTPVSLLGTAFTGALVVLGHVPNFRGARTGTDGSQPPP
jgi:hypothetical protein